MIRRETPAGAALRELRGLGVGPVTITQRKHLKLSWHDQRGHKQTVTVGATPSDWRASRNAVRDARRMVERSRAVAA
jgi:hypothetical protein